MQKVNHTRQLEQKTEKCSNCHKRPVEVYQLDTEVCFECWQNECFISFADQVDIPEV